jgi:hypothetical protein
MATRTTTTTRRRFLKVLAAAGAAPWVVPATVLGAGDRPAPSNRIATGCIGMGGRGSGDMRGFLGHGEVQVNSVCDVVAEKRYAAKRVVDQKYGDTGCDAVNDFRDITRRDDVDAIMIGTPDHWHAIIGMDAMRHGKDVFSEKPETLDVREGRVLTETARRLGRVYSGGSQRVWGDCHWIHRWTRSGAVGDIKEIYVSCGGPSRLCYVPEEPEPAGLDWNLWLGPAPWAPFNRGRLNFRPWRAYSGGGMTDWGAHNFGGALFAANLHETGPVEVHPPDGKDYEYLTYIYANGIRMYHAPGNVARGRMKFVGTKRTIAWDENKERPPDYYIPNYKGRGGIIGDFLHCVTTRERPFRDIEVAHRTVTVCHLGNIAYWVGRGFKWNPETEEVVGDPEIARWLDRPKRSPWRMCM